MRAAARAGLTAAGAALAGALWWRRNPSACPYGQRFWIEAPHPLITRARLREVLAPRPGERVLEVGPGTGYYTLDVAHAVRPGGGVDVVDLQQEMLDHTMRRARERGVENITPARADARRLPYPDASFDAAYLVAVLGGRLVVGELFGDPHWVSPRSLRARAEDAGLAFERRSGPAVGYFARFGRPV
jgi:SAM-dependent methyltransferase